MDVPDNQIESGLVFENVQTADAALAALYAGLRDSSPIAGDNSGAILGTYTDDLDFYATANSNGVYDLYRNQHIAANVDIYSFWSGSYQQVYLSNSIIEGVSGSSSLSVSDKNRIKGEALLARSVLFFYLWQVFGDFPYPVTTNYQVNQTLSKTPTSEVGLKLENDLNEAIGFLKDEYRNVERIYPNRKVAQLMLAKVYMIQHRWAEAESMLKSIIQSPLYQFQSDITKVFIKSSSHILWQLKPKNPGDPTRENQTYYFNGVAPYSYALTQNLIGSFSGNDLRKTSWTALVTVGPNTWYRSDKYKNGANNSTEYSIIFRLEEAYLLLAEALAQQNKIVEALPFINATRQRAGLSALSGITKEVLLNELLLENRKEFFTEMGHRFLDLKRFDRLTDLTSVKTNWKDFHRLWPLPQQDLLLNPQLNPQNAGY
ncbi:RagB/SusD family nutrient uptake outer membrane protein [Chryseobacterium wanjuense]|uniref:RagB/SusD family nutrient uptake outer membrane protein n=1 Tax=Chryseobacterium wanjuense TaxID=356305 RepID=UPI002937439B|nr:RagB/SusD family nutrient uptake outer membrane protein [Chryseobacterium wanjuense]